MINAHAYNITVRQIEADTQVLFEARVRGLPDVVDFGETWEEAYGLAVDSIETIAEMMAEQNRSMPEPAAIEDEYSMTDKTGKPAQYDSHSGQLAPIIVDTESSPGAWAKELARRPKVD